MTETPPEQVSGNERLQNALVAFAGCIGEGLEDICSYGLTIGEFYVPFNPDPEDECEEDEAICSQAWVRVTDVTPSINEDSFGGGTCAVDLSIGLEVGVVRCLPIPEEGEAPPASDMLVASLQSVEDMNAMLCAAMNCEVWESLNVGTWGPIGPQGGQYGGTWSFTASL